MKKSTLRGLIALFLAAVVAAGVCCLGFSSRGNDGKWFGNFKDMSSWHWTDKTPGGNEPIEPDITGDSQTIVSDGEASGMRMARRLVSPDEYGEYDISPQSVDSVYNLSVTYTPANTTHQETTYTVAFQNPNSTWATGKTVSTYATVTQSTEGSKDATLTILRPFSEKLVVTARSNRDSSIYAQTVVDYVCASIDLSLNEQGDYSGYLSPYDDIEVQYGGWNDGTLTPELLNNISVVVDMGSDFVSKMSSIGITAERYMYYVVSDTQIDDFLSGGYTFSYFEEMVHTSIKYSTLDASKKKAADTALGEFYGVRSDGDFAFKYGFKVDRRYNGVAYGNYNPVYDATDATKQCPYGDAWRDFELSNFSEYFEISATGMSVNNSHIIAG